MQIWLLSCLHTLCCYKEKKQKTDFISDQKKKYFGVLNGVVYTQNKVTVVLKASDFNTLKYMPEFQKLPYTPEIA